MAVSGLSGYKIGNELVDERVILKFYSERNKDLTSKEAFYPQTMGCRFSELWLKL
jgi:hypothetical protein